MALLSWSDAVDIGPDTAGRSRGRLASDAAASLRRVDRAFGRPADINEAWRSPEQADANYAAYLAYLRGGPWAPIALPAKDSIHCRGYAVDTDDTSDAQMRVWNDHGWFWTVYRWVNGVYTLMERWHLEYDRNRDNRRNDPAPASTNAEEFPAPTKSEEDTMARLIKFDEGILPNDPTFLIAPGFLYCHNDAEEQRVDKYLYDTGVKSLGALDFYRALRTHGLHGAAGVWGSDPSTWSLPAPGKAYVEAPGTKG